MGAYFREETNLQKNQEKFACLRALNLSLGEYVIISSGALGIRNIREIGDIDLLVSPKLWETLATRYGVTNENRIEKIVIPGGIIEAFGPDSFPENSSLPSLQERIFQAEIIDGLPFEPLDNLLLFKRTLGREKDPRDITLIEAWLKH